jgi:hypothetical protein
MLLKHAEGRVVGHPTELEAARTRSALRLEALAARAASASPAAPIHIVLLLVSDLMRSTRSLKKLLDVAAPKGSLANQT